MSLSDSEPPIACSLGVGRGEQIERWRVLLRGLVAEPIDDGVRYLLLTDRAAATVRVAIDEQACCPFFTLDVSLRGDYTILPIRTPPAGASMLAEIIGAA